jgi:hypothetical protein
MDDAFFNVHTYLLYICCSAFLWSANQLMVWYKKFKPTTLRTYSWHWHSWFLRAWLKMYYIFPELFVMFLFLFYLKGQKSIANDASQFGSVLNNNSGLKCQFQHEYFRTLSYLWWALMPTTSVRYIYITTLQIKGGSSEKMSRLLWLPTYHSSSSSWNIDDSGFLEREPLIELQMTQVQCIWFSTQLIASIVSLLIKINYWNTDCELFSAVTGSIIELPWSCLWPTCCVLLDLSVDLFVFF